MKVNVSVFLSIILEKRIRNCLTVLLDMIIKYWIIICLYKRKAIPMGGYTQPLTGAGSLNYITSLGLDLININSCACLKVRASLSVLPFSVISPPPPS